jgi:hypothetical protein
MYFSHPDNEGRMFLRNVSTASQQFDARVGQLRGMEFVVFRNYAEPQSAEGPTCDVCQDGSAAV